MKFSFLQPEYRIGQFGQLIGMSDDNDAFIPLMRTFFQNGGNPGRGIFVKQEWRVRSQRAGDCHALLLAAGELSDISPAFLPAEADPFQEYCSLAVNHALRQEKAICNPSRGGSTSPFLVGESKGEGKGIGNGRKTGL